MACSTSSVSWPTITRVPQEDEIGVQHVAAAVVVDLRQPAGLVHVLDHVPLDVHLAGLAQQVRRQVQPAVETAGAEIGQQLAKVDVRLGIVAVPRLLVGPGSQGEPRRGCSIP